MVLLLHTIAALYTNQWLTRRRPLFTLVRGLHAQLQISSASPSKVSNYNDEDCNGFLPWLERKAGAEISSVLSIGKSPYGRSLYASKNIRTGDCILKVPYSVQLAPDNLVPEIRSLLGDEVSNVAKVALLILYEQRLGQNSEWAPYISRLPPLSQMHSTIFWSDDEMEMIRPSALYQETIKQKAQIEKDFALVFNCFAEILPDVNLDDFKYAYALVTSRAWESSRGVSMIPLADFLNHDRNSESIVLSDESKQLSEVIADRDYVPGDQVFIRYGRFSNSTLLLDFGFTLPYNIYDQVLLDLRISHQDQLCDMKRELLHRYHKRTVKDVNIFNSTGYSFTIKEVKSSSGKGRGIPQSLRAFARVLCSRCPEELSDLAREAEQRDGRLARLPLKNKRREVEAHEFLLRVISQLIEEYSLFTDKVLELPVPMSPSMFGEYAHRRQLAQNLLNGELRVLKSAHVWLKEYCTTLSESIENN